jgi:hypothetical protein
MQRIHHLERSDDNEDGDYDYHDDYYLDDDIGYGDIPSSPSSRSFNVLGAVKRPQESTKTERRLTSNLKARYNLKGTYSNDSTGSGNNSSFTRDDASHHSSLGTDSFRSRSSKSSNQSQSVIDSFCEELHTSESSVSSRSHCSEVGSGDVVESLSDDFGSRGKPTFATFTASVSYSSEEHGVASGAKKFAYTKKVRRDHDLYDGNTGEKIISYETQSVASSDVAEKVKEDPPEEGGGDLVQIHFMNTKDPQTSHPFDEYDESETEIVVDEKRRIVQEHTSEDIINNNKWSRIVSGGESAALINEDHSESNNEEKDLSQQQGKEVLVNKVVDSLNDRTTSILQVVATISTEESLHNSSKKGSTKSRTAKNARPLSPHQPVHNDDEDENSDTSFSWDENNEIDYTARERSLLDSNEPTISTSKPMMNPSRRLRGLMRENSDCETSSDDDDIYDDERTLDDDDDETFVDDISLFQNGTITAMENFLDEITDNKGIQKIGCMILRLGICQAPAEKSVIMKDIDDDECIHTVKSTDIFPSTTSRNLKQHKNRGRSHSPRSPRSGNTQASSLSPSSSPPTTSSLGKPKSVATLRKMKGPNPNSHNNKKKENIISKPNKIIGTPRNVPKENSREIKTYDGDEAEYDSDYSGRLLSTPVGNANRSFFQTLFGCGHGEY